MDSLSARGESIDAKLDGVVAYIERQKGERRMIVAAGSVGGSIAGALFATFVSWWSGK
jgi:hypothetical protein